MSGEGGFFFVYDGTVKMLPCLVEDFVFTTGGDNLGINYSTAGITYAEHNSLYNEINWFYPKANSTQIDRCVTFNYGENCWTTSSLARSSYMDQGVFDLPFATEFNTATPVFPIQGITNLPGASIYYEHEKGTDQITLQEQLLYAFIRSGDFDITAGVNRSGKTTGAVNYKGDGDFLCLLKDLYLTIN